MKQFSGSMFRLDGMLLGMGLSSTNFHQPQKNFLEHCQITDLLDREIFESEWDFYDLRKAINFQRGLCMKLGLPDPLDTVKN